MLAAMKACRLGNGIRLLAVVLAMACATLVAAPSWGVAPVHAPAPSSGYADAANARQARAIFNRVYNRVFGPEGCRLGYSINIIGIYKTAGNVVMKGKKSHYAEKRYHGWTDGRTLWRADTKKRVVDIFDMTKEHSDNMLSKFKFDVNKFSYSWQHTDEGKVINVDAPSGFGGIRHAKIVLDRRTEAPLALKIKVAFFWTTVRLSGFRTGGVADSEFRFPRTRFKDYRFCDHRDE